MKYLKLFSLLLMLAFFSQCCDKIDGPYIEKNTGADTNQVVKKILLEEFTGHKCVYCPTASKLAHDLKEIYGNQLILVSIHAGFLAEPDGSGNYTMDFTTSTGDDLEAHYGIDAIGLPQGLINRIEQSGSQVIAPGNWSSIIASLAVLEQDAQLTIINDYDTGTRELNTTVKTKFYNELSGPIKICLYVTEDSIIAPQKNNNASIGPVGDILDYVHMHVLRDAINSTWGETLVAAAADTSVTYIKDYSYTLHSNWNDKHCAVVAFIYYGDTEVVIQAEEQPIE